MDCCWATVGSSNIDPFSLLLAREANACVRDRAFAAELRGALEAAIASSSRRVVLLDVRRRAWPVRVARSIALVFFRFAVQVVAQVKDWA